MTVAYLATNTGCVPRPYELTPDQLMTATGHNTGNLAFWHAVSLLLDEKIHLVGWHANARELPDDINAFIIPAANFLNDYSDLTALAKLVDEIDKPVVILGLGAQSETERSYPELKAGSLRFLKATAARSPFLCLRGEYTAGLCRSLGVTNVEVLGCPSLLINGSQRLGAELEKKFAAFVEGRLAIHAACIKGGLEAVEAELIEWVRQTPGSTYNLQRPVEFIKAAVSAPLSEAEHGYIRNSASMLKLSSAEALIAFLRQFAVVNASAAEWMHSMQYYRGAIGTRIHGTMLPLQAGVPAICITHDTRTRELTEAMHIPRLTPKEFLSARSNMQELFRTVAFEAEVFDANRRSVAKRLVALFNEVGVRASQHLLTLAA